MARIVYCHPTQTKYDYHIFTDLDFWDARRILRDLVAARRNFGKHVPGDEFPTQVVADGFSRTKIREIEKRLKRSVPSPPRHVVVRSMVYQGHFSFDPSRYFPKHWSRARMIRFTYYRLPLHQGVLCNPYQTVELSWADDQIRVTRVQRQARHDQIIRTMKDARQAFVVPSCF